LQEIWSCQAANPKQWHGHDAHFKKHNYSAILSSQALATPQAALLCRSRLKAIAPVMLQVTQAERVLLTWSLHHDSPV